MHETNGKHARRDFLRLLGQCGVVSTGLLTLGGCETLFQRIRHRPVRCNIATLGLNDPVVQAYRDAVSAMQALPASDPRNWTRQAEIHNQFCPHGNWFFLPWHRAYLLFFERICRKLSGYPHFALPYWNWTCSRSIPLHFWGASNSLDHARSVTASSQLPDAMVGETLMQAILGLSNFQLFGSASATALRPATGYGQLEGTPHNFVHGWTGMDMGTFMSPLDPVFWCHHNMIERVWWEWNIEMGNPNPSDPVWSNLSLGGMFCDEDGNTVNGLTVGATALMPLLEYRFDDELLPCSAVCGCPDEGGHGYGDGHGRRHGRRDRARMESEALREFLTKGGPADIRVLETVRARRTERLGAAAISKPFDLAIRASDLVGRTTRTRRLLLRIEDVALAGGMNDVFLRVFVNKPDATAATPIDDPHYGGSFALFLANHTGHRNHAASTFLVDVTDVLRRLVAAGRIDQGVSLNMLTVPFRPEERSGTIEWSGFTLTLSEVG